MKQAAAMVLVLCVLVLSVPAFALESSAFSASLSSPEGREGDAVELLLSYDGFEEIGAFLVQIEYDPQAFEYQKTKSSGAVRDGCFVTLEDEGRISSGYVARRDEECLSGAGELFSYRFKVAEGTAQKEERFTVSVFQVRGVNQTQRKGLETALSYKVLPPLSSEASLTVLRPEQGELVPAFSSDCFDYSMNVPFSVSSLTFFSEPAKGAVCKVNRKALGAGGSDTEFVLTVTAEDAKTKAVYRVTVHREEREAGPAPTPKPAKPSPAAKPTAAGTVGKGTPVPSSTPKQKPTVSPSAAALAVTAAASPEPSADGWKRPVQEIQTLSVREKSTFSLPAFLALGAFAAVAAMSRRIAEWLDLRFPEKKPEEKEEQGK